MLYSRLPKSGYRQLTERCSDSLRFLLNHSPRRLAAHQLRTDEPVVRPHFRSASRSLSACRCFSSTTSLPNTAKDVQINDIAEVRNISIIAHIDAGKTTCTERILHLTERPHHSSLSGHAPGDVDSGSTVTDFLEAERERGITIQSAAVGPVFWSTDTTTGTGVRSRAAITLVDTPGHIDFTIEVERAVRVVDGSVIILDGVEGVESQTENVWSQAARCVFFF